MLIRLCCTTDRTAVLTPYHAKYYAHDLTRRAASGLDRLTVSLFDAAVDLNPHQIEAALFALQSPLSKGVILADEVGLGKTIEAGIVLCQYWAERKRKLIVICPASLRKQWEAELKSKFHLSAQVIDAKTMREAQKKGRNPLAEPAVIIMSFHFANRIRDELKAIAWDLVVIDEAHKLRNAYRPNNRLGQGIRWATEHCRKLLLTATPLQNSLLELYGLSTIIDEHLFGDVGSFRSMYTGPDSNLEALRNRLTSFCKRTLRNQVTEYIRYTERRPFTQPFTPTDDEHAFYEAVSGFLQREDSYSLPRRQRHLTALILRKLLASSKVAVAATLEQMRDRLTALLEKKPLDEAERDLQEWLEDEDIDDDLLDEILNDENSDEPGEAEQAIDEAKLKEEIRILTELAAWARRGGADTKAHSLLTALDAGFKAMSENGAAPKALVFTESRRTQAYLKKYLEAAGYAGKVVAFNGTNGGPEATAIYEAWLEKHRGNDRVSGSRAIDVRAAIIEHFCDNAAIMLATEAAAEGVNLQFCSLVINYDLPWNPQRIEQRIGRCHRYGQKYDVVVINFLNQRNHADQRVLELLSQKFQLFDGIFGSSDEILGAIESGVDFEKRVLAIYQSCRTPEEIDTAFAELQQELEGQIKARLDDTHRKLIEHFDEDVHQRLRLQLADTQAQLDKVGKRFWQLTRYVLTDHAEFDEAAYVFDLVRPVTENPQGQEAVGGTLTAERAIPLGRYHLISKSGPGENPAAQHHHLYRLTHPLGQAVLSSAKAEDTPTAKVVFDIQNHPSRLHAVEALTGKSGYLTLNKVTIDSYEREEHLLFAGYDDDGHSLDQETMEKLFACHATATPLAKLADGTSERLSKEAAQHRKAIVNQSLEQNNAHFNAAREKLEKWADDMVYVAEKALADTKVQLKALRLEARRAKTVDEQHAVQEKTQRLEHQQRRQRQEIFQVEDEIMEKRDALINELERRLTQRVESETLFAIQWIVQ